MLDTPTRQSLRKDDHIHHALSFYTTQETKEFQQTRFVHHSFPEMSTQDVSLETKLHTLTLEKPFFINAMTGGSQKTKTINEKLAIIAKETRIAMASGSNSLLTKSLDHLDSFQLSAK